MSETVLKAGYAKSVVEGKENILQFIKDKTSVFKLDEDDDFEDIFWAKFDEKYVEVKDTLYEITLEVDTEYDDVSLVVQKQDLDENKMFFIAKYYNGSCCLQEALEDVL